MEGWSSRRRRRGGGGRPPARTGPPSRRAGGPRGAPTPGGLFDPRGPGSAFVPAVAPIDGEVVVTKGLPNSFAGTPLHDRLKAIGRPELIIVGFMTHMCVSATARAALDLGYRGTVVAAAMATRDLPDPLGGVLSAAELQRAELAALGDRYAVAWRGRCARPSCLPLCSSEGGQGRGVPQGVVPSRVPARRAALLAPSAALLGSCAPALTLHLASLPPIRRGRAACGEPLRGRRPLRHGVAGGGRARLRFGLRRGVRPARRRSTRGTSPTQH
ncbi:isochorismatase family protein [Cystobacter fuscus]|uniref:isochorismatase family protein n=1 Tax=Cystobacter fuscus TaxID=43 RepID=UPI0009715135